MNNIWALYKRELKEFYRNPQTMVIFLIVIFMNLLLGVAMGKVLLEMTVNLSLVMLGLFSSAYLTMEEKEKNTLQALLLSPLDMSELIIGKLLFYILLTFAVTLGSVLSMHWSEVYFIQGIIGILLGACFVSFAGTGLGIICRKQADVSGWGTLLLLSLFLPELMAPINSKVNVLAKMIPLHHVLQFIRKPLSLESLKYLGFLLGFVTVAGLWTSSLLKQVIMREGLYYRLGFRDFSFAGIFLLLMLSSAYTFVEPSARTIVDGEKSYFVLPNRKLQIPYDAKTLEAEEIKVFDRHIVSFFPKENEETRLNITFRRMIEKREITTIMSERVEDLKEDGAINLTHELKTIGKYRDGFILNFESKKGKRWSYTFIQGEKRVTIAAITRKEEDDDSFKIMQEMAIKLLKDGVL